MSLITQPNDGSLSTSIPSHDAENQPPSNAIKNPVVEGSKTSLGERVALSDVSNLAANDADFSSINQDSAKKVDAREANCGKENGSVKESKKARKNSVSSTGSSNSSKPRKTRKKQSKKGVDAKSKLAVREQVEYKQEADTDSLLKAASEASERVSDSSSSSRSSSVSSNRSANENDFGFNPVPVASPSADAAVPEEENSREAITVNSEAALQRALEGKKPKLVRRDTPIFEHFDQSEDPELDQNQCEPAQIETEQQEQEEKPAEDNLPQEPAQASEEKALAAEKKEEEPKTKSKRAQLEEILSKLE